MPGLCGFNLVCLVLSEVVRINMDVVTTEAMHASSSACELATQDGRPLSGSFGSLVRVSSRWFPVPVVPCLVIEVVTQNAVNGFWATFVGSIWWWWWEV